MKNFLSDMLYLLTSAYSKTDYDNCNRGSPLSTNIGKLFAVFAWGLENVQEQADLVLLWDDIDNARGAVLDRYGKNFGVERMSPDDEFYRLAIRVKLMSQLSGGDIDTVIQATGALLGVDIENIVLEEIFPAKINLYVDQTLVLDEQTKLVEQIAYVVKRLLVGGVGLCLYMRTYRTYRMPLPITKFSITNAHLSSTELISRDRTASADVSVRFVTHDASNFTSDTVGKDRKASTDCTISFSGYETDKSTPDTRYLEKPHKSSQRGIGGVICHSHIKSKRIN